MKQSDKQPEVENVVMYPASRHFDSFPAIENDPLEDLLTEFDHLEDTFDDMEVYSETIEANTSSLEAKLIDALNNAKSDSEKFTLETLKQDLDSISEAHSRIKFYLDELEIFIPNKK